MENLFSGITILEVHLSLFRTVVSLPDANNVFDDLSDNQADWSLAQTVASDVNPMGYSSFEPEIYRAFRRPSGSTPFSGRLKTGRQAVFQMARSASGTAAMLSKRRCTRRGITGCTDFFPMPVLKASLSLSGVNSLRCLAGQGCSISVRRSGYLRSFSTRAITALPQSIGSRFHREGHPGLVTFSARHSGELSYVVLNPAVLFESQPHGSLVYRLQNGIIKIEEPSGVGLMEISTDYF